MKINFPKSTASLLIGVLAIFCASSAIFAQDVPDVNHAWNGPPGPGPSNDWFDGNNWLPATVPLSTDNAQISNGGTADVTTHVGNATAQDLVLGLGAGTSGNLNVINAGVLNISRDFFIGNGSSSTLSTADFMDTAVVTTGRNAVIGNLAGSLGQVRLRDTAKWTVTNNLTVGGAGTGTLQIRDGAKVVTHNNFIVGNATGSMGTVDVQGTFVKGSNDFNLTSDGNTIVGNSSELDNTLDIHNGGRVATGNNAVIGSADGSNGRVRVGDDGTNSESYWFIQNNLAVGDAGTGELQIRDGGFAGTADGNTSIGRSSTGVGRMLVTGSGLQDGGSLFTTNSLFVGDAGNGRLEISDLGLVQASGLVSAGNQAMSTGRIDVSGAYAGGSSNYNLTSGGNTIIGRSGDGGMDIHDGGRVDTVGMVSSAPTVTAPEWLGLARMVQTLSRFGESARTPAP